jgi:hypothetical protein
VRGFILLDSACLPAALKVPDVRPADTLVVIPGSRAGLLAYKARRDPLLAVRLGSLRIVKSRLLRSLLEVPVLTRESFEEYLASDPLEQAPGQMVMF